MPLSEPEAGYAQPGVANRSGSLESALLSSSNLGECYLQPSDSQIYPHLTAVYNGKVLNIKPGFIHASLSGISIKHYNGKCFRESEEDSLDQNSETYSLQMYGEQTPITPNSSSRTSLPISMNTGEYSSTDVETMRPICVRVGINFRNSFWNIHRPELCKLTWPQKYVSTATVSEHLHEHLTNHGPLCAEYHQEEDRVKMLSKELDEYVRLKEICSPRELPPDEIYYNFKADDKLAKVLSENRKCRRVLPKQKTVSEGRHKRQGPNADEEGIRRSKEEFCITIGKHIRKPPKTKSFISLEEGYMPPEISSGVEEDGGLFSFDWFVGSGENSFENCIDESSSHSSNNEELLPIIEPCPPLTMDDFCRAATKADFSDLRCDPDF